MVPKLGAVPHLERGSWDPIERKVAWTEAYLRTKWHLDTSSRLATIGMGRKLGAAPLTQSRLGQGLPAYEVVS